MVITAHKPWYTDANQYWTVMLLYLISENPVPNPPCFGPACVSMFLKPAQNSTHTVMEDVGLLHVETVEIQISVGMMVVSGVSTTFWRAYHGHKLALEWLGEWHLCSWQISSSQLLHYSPIAHYNWLRIAHLRSFKWYASFKWYFRITISENPICKTVKGRNRNGENSPLKMCAVSGVLSPWLLGLTRSVGQYYPFFVV